MKNVIEIIDKELSCLSKEAEEAMIELGVGKLLLHEHMVINNELHTILSKIVALNDLKEKLAGIKEPSK